MSYVDAHGNKIKCTVVLVEIRDSGKRRTHMQIDARGSRVYFDEYEEDRLTLLTEKR